MLAGVAQHALGTTAFVVATRGEGGRSGALQAAAGGLGCGLATATTAAYANMDVGGRALPR